MQKDPVVIVSIARTPLGKFLGALKDVSAVQLGKTAIQAAIERAKLTPDQIDGVIMGCVLPAGLGQAPTRQAAIAAGIPVTVPCSTVNKVCGSGMQAVIFSHDALLAGSHEVMLVGGMESMTNAPYLLPRARHGYRIGHTEMLDHMMWDGLEDAYDKGKPMGIFAELCASTYHFSRADQDNFATASLTRAQQAIANKLFADEIVPVTIKTRQGDVVVDTDEHPGSVKAEKIPLLPPAFASDGTVTAANSSAIADGAAALVMMRQSEAEKRGLKPLAKIIGHSSASKEPSEFTTAPIDAINLLLKKIKWSIPDVDLFEINEAFAVVALAAMHDLKIPHEKLNVNGGACGLGHPIGATGARILVTLLGALKNQKFKRGIASLCIGGGEATAIAVEMF
jgi:acetyl-CoA C-acetyltransferase